MALNSGGSAGMGIELSVSDAMSPALDKANEAVKRLHDGLSKMGGVADSVSSAVAGVGLALFNAGKGFLEGAFDLAAKSGGPFQAAMHDVQFFTGATADQMQEFEERTMSAKTALMGFSANDSAQALKELSQLTGNATDSMTELEPALLLAGITGKSTTAAVDALQKTLHTFRLGADDAGEVVDQLAVSSQLFHVKAGAMADALNRAGDGAKAMRMSAADTMLTIGLMGHGMADLSQVASQANMAMIKLGSDPKAQTALKKLGVETKDASGQLRNLPDILGQIADKYKAGNEQEVISALTKTTNRKAAGELLNVVKDLSKGIVDQEGHLRKGSDAIKYYAEQQENSAQAAKKMNDALLDTFEGQEKVMKASIESLKTAVAGPLASAFKPVISMVAEGIASVTEFLSHLTSGTKTFIAQVVLAGAAITTVLGTALAFLGPEAALIFGGLILGAAALYEAYKLNLGGLADWVHATWEKVSLAFEALSSLLSGGSMSLDLFNRLNEHPGLRNFVLNIYVWVNRAKNFFSGLVDGFQEGLHRLQPVFDALSESVSKVMSHFSGLWGAVDPSANKDAFKRAGESGKSFGNTLADIAGDITKVITAILDFTDGVMNAWHKITHAFKGMGDDVSGLVDDIGSLMATMFGLDGAAGSVSVSFTDIGNAIATTFASAIQDAKDNLHSIISLIRSITHIFKGVIKVFDGLVTGDWSQVWDGMKEIAYGVVSAILASIESMALGIAKGIDALNKLRGSNTDYAGDMRDKFADWDTGLKKSMGLDEDSAKKKKSFIADGEDEGTGRKTYGNGIVGPPPSPATAEAAGGASMQNVLTDIHAALANPKVAKSAILHATTQLIVDGKVLAEAVKEHVIGDNDRAGIPNAPGG